MEAGASSKKQPFLGTSLKEYPFLGRWDQIPNDCHHGTRGEKPQPGTEPGPVTIRVSVLPITLLGEGTPECIPALIGVIYVSQAWYMEKYSYQLIRVFSRGVTWSEC